MFAKPEWFDEAAESRWPKPANLKGWTFYAVAMVAVIAPAALLVMRGQIFPETLIWLAFALTALYLESRSVSRLLFRRREAKARRDLYHIHDEDDSPQEVTGEQYRLEA